MEYINEKEFLVAFGKNLRKIRKDKGFTQEQLANDVNVEISQISRIERGIINTSIANTYAIARVLKVKAMDLFDF